jgi:hypothetical protein
VWNGPWDPTDELALAMWDKILRAGRRITAIASTDSHRQDTPIGQPATHVAARELSQATLLNAIRQGHVYLTDKATRPSITFTAEPAKSQHPTRAIIGDELHLAVPGPVRLLVTVDDAPPDATISLVSDGRVIRTFPSALGSQPQAVEIECARAAYFRLEVRAKTGAMIALTNPIYVRVRAGHYTSLQLKERHKTVHEPTRTDPKQPTFRAVSCAFVDGAFLSFYCNLVLVCD